MELKIRFFLILFAIIFAGFAGANEVISMPSPSSEDLAQEELKAIRHQVLLHDPRHLIKLLPSEFEKILENEGDQRGGLVVLDSPVGLKDEEIRRAFMLARALELKSEVCTTDKGILSTTNQLTHCRSPSDEITEGHVHPIAFSADPQSGEVTERLLNYVPSPFPNDAMTAKWDCLLKKIYTWSPRGTPVTVTFQAIGCGDQLEIGIQIFDKAYRWQIVPVFNVLARLNSQIEKLLLDSSF